MRTEDERAVLLRGRAAGWRKNGLIDMAALQAIVAKLAHPWHVNGVVVQVVFFWLTWIAGGAFYGFFALASQQVAGVITGVVAIPVAEMLIRKRKWWATGVEAGLWLGGLLSLISALPSSGKPEALLVIAAAFAIPGARLRQPVFGTIAVALVAWYFEERFDLGVVASLAFAAAALVGLARTWRRPSTEWLFVFVALVLPFVGWFAADAEWRNLTIALYAAFGAVALFLAVAKRHHFFFFSAAVGFLVAGTELARMIEAPAEAKLAVPGMLLLALSLIAARTLRGRTTGLVLEREELTPFDDELQLAATVAMQPDVAHAPAAPAPGGQFGGAGASGEY